MRIFKYLFNLTKNKKKKKCGGEWGIHIVILLQAVYVISRTIVLLLMALNILGL